MQVTELKDWTQEKLEQHTDGGQLIVCTNEKCKDYLNLDALFDRVYHKDVDGLGNFEDAFAEPDYVCSECEQAATVIYADIEEIKTFIEELKH